MALGELSPTFLPHPCLSCWAVREYLSTDRSFLPSFSYSLFSELQFAFNFKVTTCSLTRPSYSPPADIAFLLRSRVRPARPYCNHGLISFIYTDLSVFNT
jgi:hypothetical protein